MHNLFKRTGIVTLIMLGMSAYGQDANFSRTQVLVKVKDQISLVNSSNEYVKLQDLNQYNRLKSLGVANIEVLAKTIPLNKKNRHINQTPLLVTFTDEVNITATIEAMMQTGLFDYVEPDFIGSGSGICNPTVPSDQYFSRQWGLYNDGTFISPSKVDADIDMELAWTLSKGNISVIMAILDSGIKPDHPEFSGRLWNNADEVNSNTTDDDSNGYVDDIFGWDFVNNDNNPADDHGHGTNVTGIAAATGNNGIGYAGVDWKCKIMPLKILDSNNSGLYSHWISAIYYAVDNGADVMNMSVGGSGFSASMQTAINYAYANNVVTVACMMNTNSSTVFYPAGYANSIAVGSTNADNTRSAPFFWSATSGSNYGSHIDIVAPGNYIYGLSHTSNTNYNSYWGGTSQATPLVTGVVALIKGIAPGISVDSIRTLLFNGAVDEVGGPSEDVSGWDQYFGHGLLNAYNTLSNVVKFDTTLSRSVCDSFQFGGDWLSESGTYYDTLLNSLGCDSIIILELTVTGCDDGLSCTVDACVAGTCDNVPVDCNDENLCTVDTCIEGDCFFTPGPGCTVTISGKVKTELGIGIPGVTVSLSGFQTQSMVTDTTGLYNFTVVKGGNYTVAPSKDNDAITNNGITTLDISLIRKHVLGADTLDSPYKIIAADGTNSGTVSTPDIPRLRIVILNNQAKFPGERLWEFISGFSDPQNPFSLLRTRTYDEISTDHLAEDFIGVKLGDVNNSWNRNIH